jgi:putative Mn2+ efflux pump MntP
VEKCSEEGLIKNARILTVWDRRARRNEALSDWNISAAIGSWFNWQATGYGISVRRIGRNALLLFAVSTVIYLLFGIRQPEESIPLDTLLHPPILTPHVVDVIYFSVVTFTTSPPGPISVEMSQWIAMVETFFGTLLIVFLGYVLGNREQV